jgi:GntR family transcriptional regulator, transcriptional repressor for pyruvate dehydrogenase complex
VERGVPLEAQAYHARKLYVKIGEQIRSAIETGDLRPGDRLPPLAELAEQFGCSRATVREALGTLRGQGLVEFRHGNGIYVRTAALEMWMEPLEAAILLSRGETLQLVELLIALLAGIVSAAAAAMDSADRNENGKLAQALFAVECAHPYGEEVIASELSFYMELAVTSDNALFENSLRVMQEALRSTLRLNRNAAQQSKQVCRQLYDAVTAHDAPQARTVVFEYGQLLRAELTKALTEA